MLSALSGSVALAPERSSTKSAIHDSWALRAFHGQESALLMRFTNGNVEDLEASKTTDMRDE
jgi:hypothetical protein